MPDVVIPSSAVAILSMLGAGNPKVLYQENFRATTDFLERNGLVQVSAGSTLRDTLGGICIELTDKGTTLVQAIDTAKDIWEPQPKRGPGRPRSRR